MKAATLHPENYNVKFYLAVAYVIENSFDLAEVELQKIENAVHFDDSWTEAAEKTEIHNKNGLRISQNEWQRLKHEKGVVIQKTAIKKNGEPLSILHIDAFEERNEGIFYFAQGLVSKELGKANLAENKFSAAKKSGYDYEELLLSQIHRRLNDHNTEILRKREKRFFSELQRGRVLNAINILEQALIVDEESYHINHNLALLYYDMSKRISIIPEFLKKAEMYCARALWFNALYESDKEAHIGCFDLMGNIYALQKQYTKALYEYETIIRMDANYDMAYYNIGSIYYNLNKLDKAESEWRKAIEHAEETKHKAVTEKSTTDGTEQSVVVRMKPVAFLAHKSLGELYLKQNKADWAITDLERAIELKPEDADTYLTLAKAYYKCKDKEKALLALEQYRYRGGSKKKANRLEAQINER